MEDYIPQATEANYKFKELKIYSSTEWLADQKFKYRQVFDRQETTFVYVELALYNKMFDQESWEAVIHLKCFSLSNNKQELCSLEFKKQISKYEPLIILQEGWGNKKEGAFWKKGTYYWEAWIQEEKVGSKYFYIEDAGETMTRIQNPYFEVKSLRFYEGNEDDISQDDRIYLKNFSAAETRLLHLELQLKNKNRSHHWQCELFFRFYNETRELKAQVVKLKSIRKEEDIVHFAASCGMPAKGMWKKGKLYMELIFMDCMIASASIDFRDHAEPGNIPVFLPNQVIPGFLNLEQDDELNLEQLMGNLDHLVGLAQIKKQVQNHAKYLQFVQLRKQHGFKEQDEINVHSVFIGNPGTGKTTVAHMMGNLYHKMGLLSKGHVHLVDRVDLVGEYIGQTAPKVRDAIEKARGGVLFIDEAYALARSNDDSKDFGREVIEILVKEMSNGPGDMVVIVAGYPKEMKYFLDSNPGLKSRFKLYYEFTDYTPEELEKIALVACEKKEVSLSEAALHKVNEYILEAYRNRDRAFGNARYVYDLIEKAKINLGLRIMRIAGKSPDQYEESELAEILIEDVDQILEAGIRKTASIPVDEKLLKVSMVELDSLIGMTLIKKQIHELVDIVKYHHRVGRDVLRHFYLHTILIGNPGTGKTTVARILAKIYKALGILERGHMVETDRQGLVAGYVGQSALKATEKIDEAIGGVLFIDEAYSLHSIKTNGVDYGNEVIQTLLKRMEDQRGSFFVFVAGYPDNMEDFIKANPGLSSRFDKTLRFDDFQPEDLIEISKKMFLEQGLSLSNAAENYLNQYFRFLFQYRDRYFGNARTVRSVVLEAIQYHSLRIAKLTDTSTTDDLHRIELEDLESFKLKADQLQFRRSAIGFKRN
ncbi:MAG: AAA family ATPase [Saprospiraceae bacterium]|nr:AAA family ATPase [Saprospiraceae bacterium]